jgi:hypothetical protein
MPACLPATGNAVGFRSGSPTSWAQGTGRALHPARVSCRSTGGWDGAGGGGVQGISPTCGAGRTGRGAAHRASRCRLPAAGDVRAEAVPGLYRRHLAEKRAEWTRRCASASRLKVCRRGDVGRRCAGYIADILQAQGELDERCASGGGRLPVYRRLGCAGGGGDAGKIATSLEAGNWTRARASCKRMRSCFGGWGMCGGGGGGIADILRAGRTGRALRTCGMRCLLPAAGMCGQAVREVISPTSCRPGRTGRALRIRRGQLPVYRRLRCAGRR